MITVTCTINVQRKSSGTIYYTGLELPTGFIGRFLMYSIAGSIIMHRTISNYKSALPGLRFSDSYVGKTVDIIVTLVDDQRALEEHSRKLQGARRGKNA